MCLGAVRRESYTLGYVPDHLKTQGMCDKAVVRNPWLLTYVPDPFKTQKICDKAVRDYLFSLQFVPDWFVTREQIDKWYDDDYVYNDNEMIEWYDGYKKRKAQKALTKEELMPIAWHPDRMMNWCMSEDEKRRWKYR